MIHSIRKKFIIIAFAVLSAAMIFLAAVINLANWVNVRGELRQTLSDLIENGPAFGMHPPGRSRQRQNRMDESRFFFVLIGESGSYSITNATRISDADSESLNQAVRKVLGSGRTEGMADGYLFRITARESGRKTAVFLNCETKLDSVRRLLLISAVTCAGGILTALLLVMLFSKRAIQPLIRSAVQQKQFITDAGHELKTPLTVISANMDALELKTEKNEWITGTRKEVSNMRSLVNDMIYLSRMDEDSAVLAREPLDLSALLVREAEPFQTMAEFMGKTLEIHAESGLRISGDADALARLVRQLCDNAVRYAPEEDVIRLSLTREGRNLIITEENALTEPLSKEALSHLFDRFYRPDASRSRESGGYGIGLSMIRAIAEKHDGAVRAELTGEDGVRFICILPALRSA